MTDPAFADDLAAKGLVAGFTAYDQRGSAKIEHSARKLELSTWVGSGEVAKLLVVIVQQHRGSGLDRHHRARHRVQVPKRPQHIGIRQAQRALIHLLVALERVRPAEFQRARPVFDENSRQRVVRVVAEVRERRADDGSCCVIGVNGQHIGAKVHLRPRGGRRCQPRRSGSTPPAPACPR